MTKKSNDGQSNQNVLKSLQVDLASAMEEMKELSLPKEDDKEGLMTLLDRLSQAASFEFGLLSDRPEVGAERNEHDEDEEEDRDRLPDGD